jgi:hypothetical protein
VLTASNTAVRQRITLIRVCTLIDLPVKKQPLSTMN